VQRPIQTVQQGCRGSSEGKVLSKIIGEQRIDQEVWEEEYREDRWLAMLRCSSWSV